VKLLVVGKEAVGKTSLLRYLIEGKPRDPDEKKTHGIVQHKKIDIKGWSPESSPVQLNVWDFGGQEMMRGTHRFFLTERSLYLLVLEDRRQDDRSIYDWMKTIRNRGKKNQIFVKNIGCRFCATVQLSRMTKKPSGRLGGFGRFLCSR
jgi:GTPase SAR1 family protein